MSRSLRLAYSLIIAAGLFSELAAQTVLNMSDTAKTLAERWTLAREQASKKGFTKGVWIGYGITRVMGERSIIGSYSSDSRRNRPALGELITGMSKVEDLTDFRLSGVSSTEGVTDFGDGKQPRKMVKKEVGILIHLNGDGPESFDNVRVSNLSLHVDLEGDPLIWIGSADQSGSVQFLESLYRKALTREAKKRVITAIGLHDPSAPAIDFLKNILLSSEPVDVRKETAFWLSQTQSADARMILITAVRDDPSGEVREQAIFAISQMEGTASTDALITIARSHSDTETRKHAIFWLSQKASDKAVEALKEFVNRDEDSEIQKSALFALTQARDDGAVDDLISIANSHPNPAVRKDAIFWLGQSDNPKALNAIIEIIKK